MTRPDPTREISKRSTPLDRSCADHLQIYHDLDPSRQIYNIFPMLYDLVHGAGWAQPYVILHDPACVAHVSWSGLCAINVHILHNLSRRQAGEKELDDTRYIPIDMI